jgi:hypothetical protein
LEERVITCLEIMFILCSIQTMPRFDTALIASAILGAPGWARVGITAPSACLREDAALELAQVIADQIARQPETVADTQPSLPL